MVPQTNKSIFRSLGSVQGDVISFDVWPRGTQLVSYDHVNQASTDLVTLNTASTEFGTATQAMENELIISDQHTITASESEQPEKHQPYNSSALTLAATAGEPRSLQCHKTLLIQCSEYFRAALEGGFEESGIQRLQVTEFSYETMSQLIEWLYFDRIPSVDNAHDLYIAADHYNILGLATQIFKQFHHERKKHGTLPPYYVCTKLFENLPSSDPMLSCLIDVYAYNYTSSDDEDREGEMEQRQTVPIEFWIRLAVRMSDLRETKEGFPSFKSYIKKEPEDPSEEPSEATT